MECFYFSEQRFPRICLKKVTIVSTCTWPLPYQFPIIPWLFYHSTYFWLREFWGVTSQSGCGIPFLCLVAPEDDQLSLMLSCCCLIDLLMIFFFVSLLYTDPLEHINLYTPGWVFCINLSLFLHKIFFKLWPTWNATLNPKVCISFLIFYIFDIQGKVLVCILSVL